MNEFCDPTDPTDPAVKPEDFLLPGGLFYEDEISSDDSQKSPLPPPLEKSNQQAFGLSVALALAIFGAFFIYTIMQMGA